MSRHYLIDKAVPPNSPVPSSMWHTITFYPLSLWCQDFLAWLLEGNFSTQDKLKSGDRTIPTGSPQPYSPTGSIFLFVVYSVLTARLLHEPLWCWWQCSCSSSPAPCDNGKQIGGTRHSMSMDVYTWTPRLEPFLPLFLWGSPYTVLQQHWKCPSGFCWQ